MTYSFANDDADVDEITLNFHVQPNVLLRRLFNEHKIFLSFNKSTSISFIILCTFFRVILHTITIFNQLRYYHCININLRAVN